MSHRYGYRTQVWVWDTGMGMGYMYGTQVWVSDTGVGTGHRYGVHVWDTGMGIGHRYGFGTQVWNTGMGPFTKSMAAFAKILINITIIHITILCYNFTLGPGSWEEI